VCLVVHMPAYWSGRMTAAFAIPRSAGVCYIGLGGHDSLDTTQAHRLWSRWAVAARQSWHTAFQEEFVNQASDCRSTLCRYTRVGSITTSWLEHKRGSEVQRCRHASTSPQCTPATADEDLLRTGSCPGRRREVVWQQNYSQSKLHGVCIGRNNWRLKGATARVKSGCDWGHRFTSLRTVSFINAFALGQR
jgi:hypothetical protein